MRINVDDNNKVDDLISIGTLLMSEKRADAQK